MVHDYAGCQMDPCEPCELHCQGRRLRNLINAQLEDLNAVANQYVHFEEGRGETLCCEKVHETQLARHGAEVTCPLCRELSG